MHGWDGMNTVLCCCRVWSTVYPCFALTFFSLSPYRDDDDCVHCGDVRYIWVAHGIFVVIFFHFLCVLHVWLCAGVCVCLLLSGWMGHGWLPFSFHFSLFGPAP